MGLHGGALHLLALVLAVAGVGKLVDPVPTRTSLRSAGLPAGALSVRVLGGVEAGIGAAVLGVGGAWSATALALAYAGFLGYMALLRLRGVEAGCGCFGVGDRPPGALHAAFNVVGVAVGAVAVAKPVGPALEWLDRGIAGAATLGAVLAGAVLAVLALQRSGRS